MPTDLLIGTTKTLNSVWGKTCTGRGEAAQAFPAHKQGQAATSPGNDEEQNVVAHDVEGRSAAIHCPAQTSLLVPDGQTSFTVYNSTGDLQCERLRAT